jgi:hypothetical protein
MVHIILLYLAIGIDGVLAGILSKIQMASNLMVQGQDCKMDAASLSIQNL